MYGVLNSYEKTRLTKVLRDKFPRAVNLSSSITMCVDPDPKKKENQFVTLQRDTVKYPDKVFSNKTTGDDLTWVLTHSYTEKTWIIQKGRVNEQLTTRWGELSFHTPHMSLTSPHRGEVNRGPYAPYRAQSNPPW